MSLTGPSSSGIGSDSSPSLRGRLDFAASPDERQENENPSSSSNSNAARMEQPVSPEKSASIQNLSKLNFNLKLRIFYLEERLAKLQRGGDTDESLHRELFEQKLLLDEKSEEIEEREVLLVKARNAIESLQSDLQLARSELADVQARRDVASVNSEENKALVKRAEQAEARYRISMETVTRTNAQMEDALNQNDAQRKECESLKQTVIQLQREIQSKDDSINLLKDTVTAFQGQLTKLGSVQETLAHKTQELEQSRRDLNDARNQIGEASATIDRLEALHESALEKRKELEKSESDSIRRLQSEVGSINKELDEQIRQRARCESELERTSRSLEASQAQVKDFESAVATLQQELDQEKRNRAADSQTHEMQLVAIENAQRRAHQEKDLTRRSELMDLEGTLVLANQKLEGALQQRSEEQERRQEAERTVEALKLEVASASEQLRGMRREVADARDEMKRSVEKSETEQKSALASQKAIYEEKLRNMSDKVQVSANKAKDTALLVSKSEMGLRNAILAFQATAMSKLQAAEASWGNGRNAASFASDMSFSSAAGEDFSARLIFDRILRALGSYDNIRSKIRGFVLHNEGSWMDKLDRMSTVLDKLTERLRHAESKSATCASQVRSVLKEVKQKEVMMREAIQSQQQNLIKELRVDRSTYEEQRQMAETRASVLIKENAEMVAALAEAKAKVQVLNAQLDETRHARDNMETFRTQSLQAVDEIKRRAAKLEENNRMMTLELKDRGFKLESCKSSLRQAQAEISSLSASLDRVRQARAMRDRQLENCAIRMNATPVGDHRYGRGDGTPTSAIEKTILKQVEETEHLIRSATSPLANSRREPASQGVDGKERILDELVARDEQLRQMLRVLDDLVGKTSECLRVFIRNQSHQNRSAQGNTSNREVHRLLDANGRLALQMQQLGRDLQQVYLRFKNVESRSGKYVAPKSSDPLPAWKPARGGGRNTQDMVNVLNSLKRDLGLVAHELENSRA